MLIVPLARKPTWATLPLATLFLLLVNVFVFVFLQMPDEKVEKNFSDAYVAAKLPSLEFLQFRQWLEDKREKRTEPIIKILKELESVRTVRGDAYTNAQIAAADATIALHLQSDREFLSTLQSRQKKTLGAEEFLKWEAARADVDAIWRKNFTERYLFVPSVSEPITFLTHMFMHGGVGHLLGNMVMLVLIGMLIEQTIGAAPTLLLYLFGGLGSLVFELPFHGNMHAGLLGASGAIAALMGATAALLGLRKVRFFYHVVFYFDFIMLPAIVVLPVWIINELWQWALLRHESNVAYFAHVGGLVVGALLAFAYKSWPRKTAALNLPATSDETNASAITPNKMRERRAQQYLNAMDWDAARREFAALAESEPKNIAYAEQLYKLARMQPAADGFHRAALSLLSLAGQQLTQNGSQHAGARTGADYATMLANTLTDYWSLAKPAPHLSASSMAKLCRLLAKQGQPAAAELPANALVILSAEQLGEVNLADVLLTMSAAYQRVERVERAGREDQSVKNNMRAQHYLRLLEQRFPASEQLKLARQLLA